MMSFTQRRLAGSLAFSLLLALPGAAFAQVVAQSTLSAQSDPAATAAVPGAAPDPGATEGFSDPDHFPQQGGETLFRSICQGCHMPDARGATGAGTYPALAGNANLEAPGYPVTVVVHGRKGMPAFGDYLNDAQVAAVVNYVRSNFGNSFKDTVSADDVEAVR
jgi:mono/diheme cytochrome c family protein